MTKITRIYTRGGDDGTTGLVGGARIKKNAIRIQTYGTVDELSSAIGVAQAELSLHEQIPRAERLDAWLAWTQDMLFNLGSALATPSATSSSSTPTISDDDVAALERAIDAAQTELVPLDKFIHPGGSLPGAMLHLARTICRRCERQLVTMGEHDEPVPACAMRFLNRLSDALFVWARWINDALDAPEHHWDPASRPPHS